MFRLIYVQSVHAFHLILVFIIIVTIFVCHRLHAVDTLIKKYNQIIVIIKSIFPDSNINIRYPKSKKKLPLWETPGKPKKRDYVGNEERNERNWSSRAVFPRLIWQQLRFRNSINISSSFSSVTKQGISQQHQRHTSVQIATCD